MFNDAGLPPPPDILLPANFALNMVVGTGIAPIRALF